MKLLVVEDQPKVAGFLKKGLEEEGWQVGRWLLLPVASRRCACAPF